jgi:hypothetical protein
MPVSVQTPVIEYTANGSATVFAFPFRVLVASDLKVFKDGIEQSTGFTVSGVGNDVGGTVTFTAPARPAAGVVVKLQRDVPLNRATDYVEGGALRAQVLDDDIDRTVMMMQDLTTGVDQSIDGIDSRVNALGTLVAGLGGGTSYSGSAISIVAMGAVGDGVTNCTTAIQAAINAASALKTIIYVPAGTYKITGTITNAAAPNFMGIIGDSGETSIIDGSTLTTDALIFTDVPGGTRFENFKIRGPGQSAPVTSTGLAFRLVVLNNVYSQIVTNVRVTGFPTAGFEWVVPITATFNSLLAELCGTYGFYVKPKTGINVGGTSTSWNGCYANNVLGSGFRFQGHGYASMQSCAVDNANISYDFRNSYNVVLNGLGSEVNTYISGALPGYAIYMDACYAMRVNSLWTYNMPNVASRQLYIKDSTGSTFSGCSGYCDNGVVQTYEAQTAGYCEDLQFLQNYRIGNETGPAFANSTYWRLNDVAGVRTTTLANGRLTGVSYNTPDVYGNSFTVSNGSLALSGPDLGGGALNVFAASFSDYPIISASNDGSLTFGPGSVAGDASIIRTGVNLVSMPNVTGLTIKGASNPQLTLNNTGAAQQWAISGDNGDGVAFYDATGAATTMYLYSNTNGGKVRFERGLEAAQGAAGWAGIATLVAGTVTVNTTAIKSTSAVLVTRATPSGTVGDLRVVPASFVNGVSFAITSASGTDASTVFWQIVDLA